MKRLLLIYKQPAASPLAISISKVRRGNALFCIWQQLYPLLAWWQPTSAVANSTQGRQMLSVISSQLWFLLQDWYLVDVEETARSISQKSQAWSKSVEKHKLCCYPTCFPAQQGRRWTLRCSMTCVSFLATCGTSSVQTVSRPLTSAWFEAQFSKRPGHEFGQLTSLF